MAAFKLRKAYAHSDCTPESVKHEQRRLALPIKYLDRASLSIICSQTWSVRASLLSSECERGKTQLFILTRVGSHVGLQRLLAREDAVADVALDAAGRRRALADQRRDGIEPGPTATLPVPVRRRRRVRRPGLARGRAGARALEIDGHRHFVPVPREVSLVPDRGAARGDGRHHSGTRRSR